MSAPPALGPATESALRAQLDAITQPGTAAAVLGEVVNQALLDTYALEPLAAGKRNVQSARNEALSRALRSRRHDIRRTALGHGLQHIGSANKIREAALPAKVEAAPVAAAPSIAQTPPRRKPSSILGLAPEHVSGGSMDIYAAELIRFYLRECKTPEDRAAFKSKFWSEIQFSVFGEARNINKGDAMKLGIVDAILAGETPTALELRIFNHKSQNYSDRRYISQRAACA